MSGLSLLLAVLGCVACVLAIPSSLLTDVKQAESHARLTNKVKRAQEVIMFGNQQNRGGDGRNAFSLPRAEKRGIDLEDGAMGETAPNGLEAATEQPHEPYPPEVYTAPLYSDLPTGIDLEDGAMGEAAPNGLEAATEQPHEPYPPEVYTAPLYSDLPTGIDLEDGAMGEAAPNGLEAATEQPHEPYPPEDEVLEEPKVLAQSYRPLAELQNSVLKSEYYTDPASLTDLRYYDLEERRKRETFRTPTKRSSRGLAGRAKRDLDLDPEELLALLTYWENERRNKLQATRNMYNQYPSLNTEDLEMLENPESGNDLGDEEEVRTDGWMDGPVVLPSHHFTAGPRTEMWPRQHADDRRKRFMVSKRRSQEGDMYSLAQMLNAPQRDAAAPVFRRYVL